MDTLQEEELPVLQPVKTGTETFHHSKTADKFFPSGAIFFFILLVALCLVIWFGIYFLMLDRI
jgi:hypothetical protein